VKKAQASTVRCQFASHGRLLIAINPIRTPNKERGLSYNGESTWLKRAEPRMCDWEKRAILTLRVQPPDPVTKPDLGLYIYLINHLVIQGKFDE